MKPRRSKSAGPRRPCAGWQFASHRQATTTVAQDTSPGRDFLPTYRGCLHTNAKILGQFSVSLLAAATCDCRNGWPRRGRPAAIAKGQFGPGSSGGGGAPSGSITLCGSRRPGMAAMMAGGASRRSYIFRLASCHRPNSFSLPHFTRCQNDSYARTRSTAIRSAIAPRIFDTVKMVRLRCMSVTLHRPPKCEPTGCRRLKGNMSSSPASTVSAQRP